MRDLLIGVFSKDTLPVAMPCVIVMSCHRLVFTLQHLWIKSLAASHKQCVDKVPCGLLHTLFSLSFRAHVQRCCLRSARRCRLLGALVLGGDKLSSVEVCCVVCLPCVTNSGHRRRMARKNALDSESPALRKLPENSCKPSI